MTPGRGLLTLAAALGFALACTLPALSARAQPSGLDRPTRPAKHPKLDARLLRPPPAASPSAARTRGPVRADAAARVHVYVQASPVSQLLLEEIASRGGTVERYSATIVQAWLPISALEEIASLPAVRSIRPPDYAYGALGSVTTQGDAVLGAAALRQLHGVTGQGVRVGVLALGLRGLEQSVASGDLPATTLHCKSAAGSITPRTSGCLSGETLVETSGGVTGRSFRGDGNLAPSGSQFAEGTAVLEIVRDLAPGAELWFANAETGLELQQAASFLAANVDVLVSDLVFPGFFPDGQNTVTASAAEIIGNPANRARAYVQAAGNFAQLHYSGLYTASTSGDPFGHFHLFSANSETTGPAIPADRNRVTVAPGSSLDIFLSWNDPAGASANDYDLLLFDCGSNVLLDESAGDQTGTQEPTESVSFTNATGSPVDVCYVIQNFADKAPPRTLNVIVTEGAGHQFNTASKSLVAPADAPRRSHLRRRRPRLGALADRALQLAGADLRRANEA